MPHAQLSLLHRRTSAGSLRRFQLNRLSPEWRRACAGANTTTCMRIVSVRDAYKGLDPPRLETGGPFLNTINTIIEIIKSIDLIGVLLAG
jgi:hypothetical protein